MPLQATSGAASYDAFGGGVAAVPNYIEDVFGNYLYTGNGTSQTITNGIDLSTFGGLVWAKDRSVARSNQLHDSARGFDYRLISNTTDAQSLITTAITSVSTTGFSIGSNTNWNASGETYASWTFRKQPKFFDVVTYTGTGTNRTIPHNLGSVPGCIIIKRTDSTGNWPVYHRSFNGGVNPANYFQNLNLTNAAGTSANYWNNTPPTSTDFTVGIFAALNASGGTYVAYLFAHDAGGFGLTGTDNVISCGSYTGNGSTTGPVVNLGFEPQWLLVKESAGSSAAFVGWYMFDTMRGFTASGVNDAFLRANESAAEDAGADYFAVQPTGFQCVTTNALANESGGTYIYIAIRRGPMKVPTSGASVFSPVTYTGNGATGQTITSVGFPLDFVFDFKRSALDNKVSLSRLTANNALYTNLTDAQNPLSTTAFTFDVMNGFKLGNSADTNGNGDTFVAESFRRAPSYFDVVCYTGTGSARTVTHNLGVAPELMIVKDRSRVGTLWITYAASQGNTKWADLSDPSAFATGTYWNNTSPTSSVFSVSALTDVNSSGDTYVAYLFATCAGVSKVGSYTGTGTTKQVDCGFTAGARFVLIKRTDSTGDWYVWDSARGIVSGNDPYLLMNSSAAEVTTTDYIDTYSAGFEISSTAPAAINANGGTFIFLAIA